MRRRPTCEDVLTGVPFTNICGYVREEFGDRSAPYPSLQPENNAATTLWSELRDHRVGTYVARCSPASPPPPLPPAPPDGYSPPPPSPPAPPFPPPAPPPVVPPQNTGGGGSSGAHPDFASAAAAAPRAATGPTRRVVERRVGPWRGRHLLHRHDVARPHRPPLLPLLSPHTRQGRRARLARGGPHRKPADHRPRRHRPRRRRRRRRRRGRWRHCCRWRRHPAGRSRRGSRGGRRRASGETSTRNSAAIARARARTSGGASAPRLRAPGAPRDAQASVTSFFLGPPPPDPEKVQERSRARDTRERRRSQFAKAWTNAKTARSR